LKEYEDINGEKKNSIDFFPWSEVQSLENQVNEKLLKEKTLQVIDSLSLRESIVIKKRFALDGEIKMTLEDIGKLWGMTKNGVRRIEQEALKKIKYRLFKISYRT